MWIYIFNTNIEKECEEKREKEKGGRPCEIQCGDRKLDCMLVLKKYLTCMVAHLHVCDVVLREL
jgi:hypothetical protein